MSVSNWDRRQLCPDGACIGVIGPDGLCKVCGRVAQGWGDERKRGLEAEAEAETDDDDDLDEDEDYDDEDDEDELDDDEDQDDDEDDDPISPGSPAVLGALAEWNDRRLCIDGACIGLLADDGTCKVCGKAGSKAKPGSAKAKPVAAASTDDDTLEAAARDLAASAAPGEVAAIAPVPALDDDLEQRKLCPDGGCVGVIGADGRCKVCGKEAP